MGRQHSLRSKAAHFVSDLTTVFLNPISDNPSNPPPDEIGPKRRQLESITEVRSEDLINGPDTSSFTAFLYSLLVPSGPESNSESEVENDYQSEVGEPGSETLTNESGGKKSLFSKGKHSFSKVFYQAAKISGYRNQLEPSGDIHGSELVAVEMRSMQTESDHSPRVELPDISEPSLLLSEKTRSILYLSLPVHIQGRKWVLLYSTWRHGISLSTLYRRSRLWPGLSLLFQMKNLDALCTIDLTNSDIIKQVVGDCKGAVFGGLVEAPLSPTNKRKYQGSNDTFVFTNTPGHPIIFRPTGVNRYFTLCSIDFLALGGGNHFALYLDGDLLNGSSSASETYGNSCLAQSEDFEVKEVELWGFVHASRYEELVEMCRTEAPGICRW